MDELPTLYHVLTPPELLDRLRNWGRDMAQSGRGQEYANALKRLNANLQEDPYELGDLLNNYNAIIRVSRNHTTLVSRVVWGRHPRSCCNGP
jgi:hypothetical protein